MVRKLHAGFGVVKFWRACDSQLRKIVLHPCPDLSKPVGTCPNLSAIQWPCTIVVQCHFLHFRMLLFFSLMSYCAEIAYFISPNREHSNGVQLMELYWNRNVDPSRSPCLKTIDRTRFQGGNFLVLRPVLLKIAYFNSANRQLSNNIRPVELWLRKNCWSL